MILSADDIAGMRESLSDALPDQAQIQRRTLTSDGMGGYTETWSTVATVDCRIAPVGQPDERAVAEKLAAVSAWTITVPALTDVQAADRIVIGQQVFEVAGVLAGSWELARRVVCVEVV